MPTKGKKAQSHENPLPSTETLGCNTLDSEQIETSSTRYSEAKSDILACQQSSQLDHKSEGSAHSSSDSEYFSCESGSEEPSILLKEVAKRLPVTKSRRCKVQKRITIYSPLNQTLDTTVCVVQVQHHPFLR